MEWKVNNSSRLVREVKTPGKLLPPRLTRPRGKYRHNNLTQVESQEQEPPQEPAQEKQNKLHWGLAAGPVCTTLRSKNLGGPGPRGTVLWDFPPGARPGSPSKCWRKVLSCWWQGGEGTIFKYPRALGSEQGCPQGKLLNQSLTCLFIIRA